MTKGEYHPEVLDNAPLHYAPQNELGVVFLFCHLAHRWRLKVHSIQAGFPDCVAFQKVGGKERKIRIEFEFRSRNFEQHKHKCRDCDWLVCWEHNWARVPKKLKVIELRREFGLGFNVWIMPVVGKEFKDELNDLGNTCDWTAPAQAHRGDLILFYETRPEKRIQHVFQITSRVEFRKGNAAWRDDYRADMKRVCLLKSPIFFEDLQRDTFLSTAGFVRGNMRGRPRATEHWPYLHGLITRRNPSVSKSLKRFNGSI